MLVAGRVGEVILRPNIRSNTEVILRPNIRSNIEVAKPQVFDGSVGKVSGFLIAYKLFIKIKMRRDIVKNQIQWILSYLQRESVDIWKENILGDLKTGVLKYEITKKFLADLRKEFREGDKEAVTNSRS